MKNTLIIAKREITRLRSRFKGRSRLIILLVIAFAFIISYLVSQQGFVLSKDFYALGLSPGSPVPSDERFNTIALDDATGRSMLNEGNIDIYLCDNTAEYRSDERSQYATGALKQYLEKRELLRISNEYDIDEAFPLRIELNYLRAPEGNLDTGTGVSLWDIIESTETTTGSASTPVPATTTSTVVMQQLDRFKDDAGLPEFKAEFGSDKEIIVPSLMNPPIPLAQVIIAFLYVVPIFFISIFQ